MNLFQQVWHAVRPYSNPVSAFFQALNAYRYWYQHGRVCILAIENSLTNASGSFTVQRQNGVVYAVDMMWFDHDNKLVYMHADSEDEVLYYTFMRVLKPMLESVDVDIRYSTYNSNGTSTTCYITETGAYYVTYTANYELVDAYKL